MFFLRIYQIEKHQRISELMKLESDSIKKKNYVSNVNM